MIPMLIAVSISLLTLAAAACLSYQILKQNGRLLLRLENAEAEIQRIAAVPVPNQASPPAEGLPVGSLAPDVRLPDLSGKLTALSGYRGQRVLLIFFNIGCGFCARMAPALKALTLSPGDTGPITLIVATGDPAENAEFFRSNGIECPVLLQKEMEVASLFKAQGTPMGYLIDERGEIASDLAAGEAALLALVGIPGLESSARLPTANRRQNGTGNGHHHSVPRGNRPLEDSQLNRSGLKAGATAPLFNLPRIDHGDEAETLSLESFRGQRVLLVFSDPNCGPCGELAVRLERHGREHPSTQILMVSRGEPAVNRDKIAEQQLTFPVVLQRQWEISKLYGMFATPIAYLIDEQGAIVSDVAVGIEPVLRLFTSAETTAVQLAPA